MFLKKISVVTRLISFIIFITIAVIEKNTYFLVPILLLCIYSSIDHENLFISILNFLLFIPIFFYKLKYIAEIILVLEYLYFLIIFMINYDKIYLLKKLGFKKDFIYKLLHSKEEAEEVKKSYKLSFNSFYKKNKLYIEFTKTDIIFLLFNILYLIVVIL